MDGLSKTLETELERYQIGPRIRALRLKKQLALTQLAAHTGLSTAMLSKIERGRLFPTLPTLVRIALVFGVGLDHFFSRDRQRPLVSVVRASERLRLPVPPAKGPPAYLFESLDYPAPDRRMESYYAEFPMDSRPSDPHQHGSAELVFIIEGELELTVGAETVLLGKGDAAYFDSSVSHGYCRRGSGRCSAIVVTVP
ncbi:helix-turn-helix domain-containing protein [Sinorhizobium alkalisoli]|uniref:helix-turn-helix domain-containing protein n=1 Tax=Sinorhizobium alkalisoli TaxID=1752398 RepID=UPI00124E8E23|nr:XRE family transcriptional regulator [Sinorhizobium alkalisoli]QFI68965.1 Transcriptional regulator, MerR family [Sinorhizobium alkalisoli]